MNGFQGLLGSLGPGRLIGIVVGGFVSFALIYFLMAQMGGTPMTPLLYGLSEEDSMKIQVALDQQNVEYESLNGGSTIMVEEGHAARLRVQFAGEGIGTGSIVGYEIFDKSETLGSTNFVQNINRVRALEGELTRTIMSINSIESARVHLTIAKRELFQRDKETAKATVVVRSRGGAPDNNTVRAIQHIVANSVAGLSPSSVTIADETGGLLASGNAETGGLGGNSSIEEKIYSIEERTRQKIYEILSGVIPIGKARVQVQVDVQRDAVKEDIMTYNPDGQVISRSDNTEDSRENIDSNGADKAVSVANSLPGGDLNETIDPASTPQKVDKQKKIVESISYLNSVKTTSKTIQPGEVKRLSIAVIVDGNYTTAGDGTQSYTRRTDAELSQLTRLIQGAIGYNEERGDTIVVQSMEFAAVDLPEGIIEPDGLMGFSSAQLVEVLKTLIIGVIVLLLTILVIRPLMKAALTPMGGQMALAGGGGGGSMSALPGQQPVAGQLSPPADATVVGPAPAPEILTPRNSGIKGHIDVAQIEGQVQASSLKQVGELVESHPDETVAIIRNWLHNEE